MEVEETLKKINIEYIVWKSCPFENNTTLMPTI